MDELCSIFSYFSGLALEPFPSAPWRSSWNGEPCSWATNEHLAVVVIGGDATDPPKPTYNEALQKYLAAERTDAITINSCDLKNWVGPVVKADEVECDSCLGGGYSDGDEIVCEHCHSEMRLPCDKCGGAGKYRRPLGEHAGIIVGQAVNRRYVAKLLAVVPASKNVTVSRPVYPKESVRFDGDGWVAFLMGLRYYGDAPTFSAEAAAAVK